MDNEYLKESIKVIEDAISGMLQAVYMFEARRAEDINIEWLVSSCAKLNEVKLGLEGEIV